MKKLLLPIFFASLSVNANILDDLKEKPASMYSVGKIKLELGTYLLNDKLKGERLKGTDFKIKGFSVVEESNSIFFKASLIGRAKDMSDDTCQKMKGFTDNILPHEKTMRDIWSGLTDKQYTSLSKAFFIKTELVSKENESFTIDC
ncbi:hypothetical protein [Pseudoalteromonas sp. S1608]|uniref:hypothetical protein n=1 Tax=Pseudoalteromonas sp. S1608 TaxID=579504 RepID=UPI00110B3551|nr:hypothetical protein [Pseudoalteromonas sp. S1608]TMP75617.1 hypothetical protein CWB75_04970 [Pseudoalteromonas sp. S1608]